MNEDAQLLDVYSTVVASLTSDKESIKQIDVDVINETTYVSIPVEVINESSNEIGDIRRGLETMYGDGVEVEVV